MTHLCDDCAEAHRATEATHRLPWDLGAKWLCKDCAAKYAGWFEQEED